MARDIKVEFGARYYTAAELIEIGRRHSETFLTETKLIDDVRVAEREGVWRARGAAELARGCDVVLADKLLALADQLEKQQSAPTRGTAKSKGASTYGGSRRLPRKGSLITKRHAYQGYNVPSVTAADGTIVGNRYPIFRFVVVDERGRMLLLGDKYDVIHNSPSGAAKAATGNIAENGWQFLGIE